MAISEVAIDDLIRKVTKLEDEVSRLRRSRRLQASSIGAGGLRLVGGTLSVDEGGRIHVNDGVFLAGDPEGGHALITSQGYRLINSDGEVDVDLTNQGSTNQIRLRGIDNESSEILLNNRGVINGRVLNVDEINLDGQNLADLLVGNNITDPDPDGSALTTTYTAQWSQCYQGNNTQNNFASGLNQGFYSGTNGNQKSLIGFDSTAIQNDHGGRTVTRVRVFIFFDHWYFNSGGTAIIGYHGHTSAPSTFAANTDEVRSAGWPKPGGRWVGLGTGFWANGDRKGISLGPGPTTSKVYYGRARRHNQPKPPRLEIRSTP